jgi:hypothetical protein
LRPQGRRRREINWLSNDLGKLAPKTNELEKANRPAELDQQVNIAAEATLVTSE